MKLKHTLIIFNLLFFCAYSFAQQQDSTDTTTSNQGGMVTKKVNLEVWDSLKIDPYHMDPNTFYGHKIIQLIDSTQSFHIPTPGITTSKFGYRHGRRHMGIDLDLVTGDKVQVAFNGVVRIAKYMGGYGNCVVVKHYNGLETLYGHLSKIKVHVGDSINAGHVIGLGGSTGHSTGSHLHFEVMYQGERLNPSSFIDFKTKQLKDSTFFLTSGDFKFKGSASTYKKKRKSTRGRRYHRIRRGDTLYGLARKYRTKVSRIKRLNGLRSTKLRIGRRIRVR